MKHRGSWQMYRCQLCAGNNGLWCKQEIDEANDNYQCQWRNDDDILEMILNLEQGTLQFIVNEDSGIAFKNIKKASYRLAMTCARNSTLQSTSCS